MWPICCVTLDDSSQRVVTCSAVIFLLVAQTLAFPNVVQNVTRGRDGDGDYFSNPDDICKPDSCREYKNIHVGGYAMHSDDCECSCSYDQTFVVNNTTCVDNNDLHSNLLEGLPGKDGSFRVTAAESQCRLSNNEIIPTLDITTTSSRTLCLTATLITNCDVIGQDSYYYYKGVWNHIWPSKMQQDTFNITEEKADKSTLHWSNLGKQFTGLIFGLRISCHLKGSPDGTIKSYLIFKSAGSHYFNDDKPTFAPKISATTSQGNEQISTTQSSTMAAASPKGNDSSKSSSKGLIIGLTIFAILVIIVIVAVVIFFLRRKRLKKDSPAETGSTEIPILFGNERPQNGVKSEANPTYELGQDRSIPVIVNGQTPTSDYPDLSSAGYQPLVQNTRIRDATGQVPVYTSLNEQTKNGQKPVVQLKQPDKRGLAYETVAVPIQQPTEESPVYEESHDYEDPTNPTINIPNEGGLYAISSPQDGNTIDFENTAYKDPDSVIKLG